MVQSQSACCVVQLDMQLQLLHEAPALLKLASCQSILMLSKILHQTTDILSHALTLSLQDTHKTTLDGLQASHALPSFSSYVKNGVKTVLISWQPLPCGVVHMSIHSCFVIVFHNCRILQRDSTIRVIAPVSTKNTSKHEGLVSIHRPLHAPVLLNQAV